MGIKLSVVSSCNTSSDMSICDWVLEIGGNDIEWLFNSVCLKEGGLVLVENLSIFMRLRSEGSGLVIGGGSDMLLSKKKEWNNYLLDGNR